MNRIIFGAVTAVGTSALALSLLAAPANAAPQQAVVTSSTASKPSETLPEHVTVKDLYTTGVKAKFAGLKAGKQYDFVYSNAGSGGPVGSPTASKKGTITATYKVPDPGKGNYQYYVGIGYLGLYTPMTADGTTTKVVSKTLDVRYGSSLKWAPAKRHGDKVTLKVTARQWSPDTTKNVLRSDAKVKFQKKVGAHWKTVKTVTTSSSGVAKTTITAAKHRWRAVVASTKTVWTSKTGTHKK